MQPTRAQKFGDLFILCSSYEIHSTYTSNKYLFKNHRVLKEPLVLYFFYCHGKGTEVIISTLSQGSFKKYVRRAGGVLKKRTKTNRVRGGQVYLYVRSCEKNCLVFKHQAEFFLISCLAVAKCFLF